MNEKLNVLHLISPDKYIDTKQLTLLDEEERERQHDSVAAI